MGIDLIKFGLKGEFLKSNILYEESHMYSNLKGTDTYVAKYGNHCPNFVYYLTH